MVTQSGNINSDYEPSEKGTPDNLSDPSEKATLKDSGKGEDSVKVTKSMGINFESLQHVSSKNVNAIDEIPEQSKQTTAEPTKAIEPTNSAINDSPSADDYMGFTPFVKAISRMITHPDTATPITIGIFGPWGTGKHLS